MVVTRVRVASVARVVWRVPVVPGARRARRVRSASRR
jgi:hypothetical protein